MSNPDTTLHQLCSHQMAELMVELVWHVALESGNVDQVHKGREYVSSAKPMGMLANPLGEGTWRPQLRQC